MLDHFHTVFGSLHTKDGRVLAANLIIFNVQVSTCAWAQGWVRG